MVGRFIGFAVMRTISPGKALAFNAAAVIVLVLLAIFSGGTLAMWAMLAVGLFNSIMFPTIFSMALNKLGPLTGQGSGLLCMAIVGGALVPFAQGLLADNISLQLSFLVPAACYLFILYFRPEIREYVHGGITFSEACGEQPAMAWRAFFFL
jgi:FHS family L-fucose permease-like MFS transporter